MFNLTFPHSYKEFYRLVEDKYSYMSPVLILYKDAKGEIVTIDSDFVYKSCLDDAWNQGKIENMPIYIKQLGGKDDGWYEEQSRGFF